MNKRGELIEILSGAAARCNALFLDPSDLIAQRGREATLANNGEDIYHYSPQIHLAVADWLLDHSGLRRAETEIGVPACRVALAVQHVNDALVGVHKRRADDLGIDASGLYRHYQFLLDANEIAGRRVAELANLIVHLLPTYERYDILCAGLGELGFVLAMMGLPTAIYDDDAGRFGAIRAGLDALWGEVIDSAQRPVVEQTTIPTLPNDASTLGVAYHLNGFDRDVEGQVLKALSGYQALLFEPRNFICLRESSEQQEWLLKALEKMGFTEVREFPYLGLAYCAKRT